jgi:hypothetical protein
MNHVTGPGIDLPRGQHIDLATVLGQATQGAFLKAELLFDHSEWVLYLGTFAGPSDGTTG